MADQVKVTSRLSMYNRVILYSTPVVASLLFCITFYQLTLQQSLLRELQLQSRMTQQQVPNVIPNADTQQIPEMNSLLRRYARTTGSDKGSGHVLEEYLKKIVEWQVSAKSSGLFKTQCYIASHYYCMELLFTSTAEGTQCPLYGQRAGLYSRCSTVT